MVKKKKKIKHSAGQRKKGKKLSGSPGVSSLQSVFQQALGLHQAGHGPEAEALYRQILLVEPDHPDALHYLGLLAYQAGKSGIAIDLISRALSCRPDYVDAHINLGITLKAQGRLDEAVVSFRRALSLKPDDAVAHYNLGLTLKDQGKLDEAIASFHRTLTLKPDYIKALNNLGITLQDQGRLNESAACFRQVLTLNPEYGVAHYNLGIALNSLGKLDEAAACYRRALTLEPDYLDAYINLGIILKDQGKLDESAACFRRALALKPDYLDGYINLGIILNDQGKVDESAASFRQALTLKPDSAEAHYNLGIISQSSGRQDEAIASYRQALALQPDFAKAHHNLGVIFSESGRIDEAITCYKKALSLKPHYAETYKNLSAIVKYTEVDDAVYAMQDLYNKKGDIPDSDRIDLGFALGKVFGDLRDYDKAFDFLLEANLLKRRSYEYSIQKDRDLFGGIKRIFSPEFFVSHHGSGSKDKTPIFIIGMPRSGTTLVEQILASHPLVYGAGELAVLVNLTEAVCRGEAATDFPECMEHLGMDAFEKIGAAYIEKIREYANEAEYITDKMPDNFLRVGLIRILLPNAKVIHCMRNPMDTCFSIFKNDFKGLFEYAYDMVELGRYYNLYNDLMAHWEKVLPGFMYTLKYEEIVSDQQNQTKNLVNFCGLPWDEACLAFHKTERRVGTSSLAQVRQPIYKDSVELWKRYERQLEPLQKAIYG